VSIEERPGVVPGLLRVHNAARDHLKLWYDSSDAYCARITAEWRGAAPTSGLGVVPDLYKPKPKPKALDRIGLLRCYNFPGFRPTLLSIARNHL
jgi:hypothetical protein